MINRKLRYLSIVEKRLLFVLTGLVSGATIGLLVYYNLTGHFPPTIPLILLILGAGLLGLAVQLILYRVSNFINRLLPWQRLFTVRFGLEILISGGIGILLGGIALVATLKTLSGSQLEDIWENYWQSFLLLWLLTVVFVLIYTIIMLLFYAQFHYAEGQIHEIKSERKQIKLQFEALKNQLSPHYLFNSLNTISSLLYQDKREAEEFIRRLAETYHYILSTHKQQLVTLNDELEFVQAYYFLLCVRYKEGLRLQINIPDHLKSSLIPPMTLQILVENAIKHNSFSLEEPLNIELKAKNDSVLQVVNNKTRHPAQVKSHKIGLENISLRYQFLTSINIKVLNQENFEVAVPLIPQSSKTVAA